MPTLRQATHLVGRTTVRPKNLWTNQKILAENTEILKYHETFNPHRHLSLADNPLPIERHLAGCLPDCDSDSMDSIPCSCAVVGLWFCKHWRAFLCGDGSPYFSFVVLPSLYSCR